MQQIPISVEEFKLVQTTICFRTKEWQTLLHLFLVATDPTNRTKLQSKELITNKQLKYTPKLLGIKQRKQQVIHGGSNHALDTMLESEIQIKRKIKRAMVPIILE
jgi:hypothetical protein